MSANLMSLARSGGKFLKLFGDRKMMKQLPYDAEVEYLESTGTQWIDTGVEPTQELAFNCSFAFEGITPELGYGNVFGSRYSSTIREYQLTGFDNGSIGIGTRNSKLGFYSGVKHTVSFDGANTVNINGVSRSITTSTCAPTTGSIVLFGIRQNGSLDQLSEAKIYALKFTINSTTLRDFIPVRLTNDNGKIEGAFYDKVSGQLFGNAGTGAFIIGPDKTI